MSDSLYPSEQTSVQVDNAYRRIERIYKQHHKVEPNRRKPVKAPLPDLTHVIDFENPNEHVFKIELQQNEHYLNTLKEYQSICSGLELPSVESWNVFGLKTYDGFMYVRGLIPPHQQLYWMNRYAISFSSKSFIKMC
jgi:hypothetical protein